MMKWKELECLHETVSPRMVSTTQQQYTPLCWPQHEIKEGSVHRVDEPAAGRPALPAESGKLWLYCVDL